MPSHMPHNVGSTYVTCIRVTNIDCLPSLNIFGIYQVLNPQSTSCASFFFRFFGAAFELGRHELCAQSLNHKVRKFCTFRGYSEAVLFRKTYKWTGELTTGLLRLRSSQSGEPIQDGRPMDQIARDPVTAWCGPALFCLSFSLAEISMLKKFVILLYEEKLLFKKRKAQNKDVSVYLF